MEGLVWGVEGGGGGHGEGGICTEGERGEEAGEEKIWKLGEQVTEVKETLED